MEGIVLIVKDSEQTTNNVLGCQLRAFLKPEPLAASIFYSEKLLAELVGFVHADV